jgi:hypothetical protein
MESTNNSLNQKRRGNSMKKIAFVLALLFFLGTVSMASATTTKVVNLKQACRSGDIIIYGMFDAKDNSVMGTIEAEGFYDLVTAIKVYELKNDVHLIWNFNDSKRPTGTEVLGCDGSTQ